MKNYTSLLLRLAPVALCAVALSAAPAAAADPFVLPPIEHLERLASWRAGVAAADAQERPLQIVCIGDSNTEGAAYVGELRRLLQGCYGERGIGYHSLGDLAVLPESPKIARTGTWEFLRDAPKGPPPPRFALDGIWCQTVKQFTMDEKNTVIPWEVAGEFPYSVTPLAPYGYEVKALIPLPLLALKPESAEFLLECAVSAAPTPGAKPVFSRLFATRGDAGAFRDASLSARVQVGR